MGLQSKGALGKWHKSARINLYPYLPKFDAGLSRSSSSDTTKGGDTAPRDAAASTNPTVDSPAISYRWDGAIRFIEPADAFPHRSSCQPTGGTKERRVRSLLAFTRSRYRRRRARMLLYLQNPSDTPPASVAVTLRLLWYIPLMPRYPVVLHFTCQSPADGQIHAVNGVQADTPPGHATA